MTRGVPEVFKKTKRNSALSLESNIRREDEDTAMTSLQEALTEALEHPISEPPARPRTLKKKYPRARKASEDSSSLLWGVLGSVAAALLVFGVYSRFVKPTA